MRVFWKGGGELEVAQRRCASFFPLFVMNNDVPPWHGSAPVNIIFKPALTQKMSIVYQRVLARSDSR